MNCFENITTVRRKALRAGVRTAIAAGLLAATAMPAFAQLNRVGPVGPLGYPGWYQDKTGLTLEFCDNQTPAELEGGWCVLLPGDLPTGAAPETRIGTPVNFADEHFYYLLSAGAAGVAVPGQPGVTTRVLLVSAIEAAFGGGPVKAGDEMVFARLRIRIETLPYSGTYTVYTPFGKRVFEDQVAGERLFATEDVGLTVGNFQEALNGSIFPFVVPSATPGGAEMPPVSATVPAPDTNPAHFGGGAPTPYPGNGRRYIADPARLGPVTGSLADFGTEVPTPNIFQINIDGPDVPGGHTVLYSTTDFSLAGRIFEGAIPGDVKLDRASYARNVSGTGKIDIYATASPITAGRVPAQATVPPIPSSLVYYNAACVPTADAAGNLGAPYSKPANATSVPLRNSGTTFFAQYGLLPAGMAGCLEANATMTSGQATTIYMPVHLTDQLTISQADYDAAAQTLTIRAASSDASVGTGGAPVQTLTAQGFGNLASGQLVVNQLLAPPHSITVTSSGGGSNSYQVSTGTPAAVAGGDGGGGGTTPPAPVAPIASNVAAATVEEAAVSITVTSDPSATITLVTTGVLGTAAVSGPGTITFTPNANASGTDAFAFTLTKGGLTSNTATVTVSIAPVNDAPVAVAEIVSAINGVTASINLMSNDIDPDGPADLAAIVVDSADARLGAISVSGGVATFTPAANAGTVNVPLTYHTVDVAGARSASVTSTVRLSTTETITPLKWQYTVSQNRWVVTGTVNPNMGQTMTVSYASGTYNVWNSSTNRFVCTPAAGQVVGVGITDGTATWTFDQPNTAPNSIFNPTNSNNSATSPGGSRTNFWCQTPSVKITSSATGNSVTPGAVQVK